MNAHYFNVQIAQELGIQKAILLNYLEFWVRSNSANNQCVFEGKAWVYHTAEAFVEIFPYFSKQVVWRLLRELESEGYILVRHCSPEEKKKSKSHLVKYYTLTQKYYDLESSFKNESVSFKNESVSFKNESVSFKNESDINDISNLENNITRLEVKKESKKDLEKNSYAQTRESETTQAIESGLPRLTSKSRNDSPPDQTQNTQLAHNEHQKILGFEMKNRGFGVRGEEATLAVVPEAECEQSAICRSKPNLPSTEQLFAQIWDIYPRKVSRKQAYKSFKKRVKDFAHIRASILEHIEREWRGKDSQYIPHLSTFLNQERYLDKLAPPSAQSIHTPSDDLVAKARAIEMQHAREQNRTFSVQNAKAILTQLKAQVAQGIA